MSEACGHELVMGDVTMQEARVMGRWYVGRAHMGEGEAVHGWSQACCVLGLGQQAKVRPILAWLVGLDSGIWTTKGLDFWAWTNGLGPKGQKNKK